MLLIWFLNFLLVWHCAICKVLLLCGGVAACHTYAFCIVWKYQNVISLVCVLRCSVTAYKLFCVCIVWLFRSMYELCTVWCCGSLFYLWSVYCVVVFQRVIGVVCVLRVGMTACLMYCVCNFCGVAVC